MDPKPISPRPDVVATLTTPRVTPTPSRTNFSDVLARGVVRGAAGAAALVPGVPLVALAVRGAAGAGGGGAMIANPMSLTTSLATAGAEGPGAALGGGAGSVLGGVAGAAAAVSGGNGGIEASLAQSQDTNMYFLQLQQQVDAQNRTFTTLSNVLKAESDTVKNAIGNIH